MTNVFANGSACVLSSPCAAGLLVLLVAVLPLMLGPPGHADSTGEPVFRSDSVDGVPWEPRPGVMAEIRRVEGRGACLYVAGRQDGGWNYATTRDFPLRARHKYRITGWVFVEAIDPALPPYFKVEYVGDVQGRANTTRYDLARGGWQELAGEFECPQGTTGGWIALEKGADSPVTLKAYVDDVSLVEIDEYTAGREYHFETLPAPLAAFTDVHPRLHLTADQLEELRGKLASEPYARLFRGVRELADRGVTEGPPEYVRRDRWSGDEQLWQRPVGNMIPHLALVYLLTGERQYLRAARDWMLASAAYPTWGLGRIDGLDLAAGHQLYGLSLGYDWLYCHLDEATRRTIRDCLRTRGQYMYEQLLLEQIWWHNSYLQNHQWVNMTGLAAAGLALFGEVEGVNGWILLPLAKFRATMESLGPDGASHEGVPYWSYGLEYMLKFMDLAEDLLEEDLFKDNAWFARTAYFRLYSMLPQKSWARTSSLMTFADGPRHDWYGPEYLLRKLAAEYRDSHAQWLADTLDAAGLCGGAARFLNLLWVDPTVQPLPPTDLPLCRHFNDMGIVFARSSWDGEEALLGFKCGPHIGRHAVRRYSYDPGGGHVHPDAASFLLFAYGDWLIIDDGYTFKTTAFQNTALVNGIGQEGEGHAWFRGSKLCAESRGAEIVRVESGEEYDYLIGDVTQAYKREAALSLFRRHILYLRPDCWVVMDELAAEKPSMFELYFHADFPFEHTEDKAYSVRGPNGSLRLTVLFPETATGESFQQQLIATDGDPSGTIEALRLSHREPSEKLLFITVLEAHPSAAESRIRASITEEPSSRTLILESPGKVWRFRLLADRSVPEALLLVPRD